MTKSKEPRLPNGTQRIAIVGRTGSGKTVAGLWHLSRQNFTSQPWVIIDYKIDENINAIERAENIDLDFTPKKPGIYIVNPDPSDDESMKDFLYKIWMREKIGIWVDEGYMLGSNKGFVSCLTQGRSKHIPMIVLSQRPVEVSRFAFSEADFFQVFHLNDERDRKTVRSYMPPNTNGRLPDYHSHYYDVGRDLLVTFKPVPAAEESLAVINERLEPRKRVL